MRKSKINIMAIVGIVLALMLVGCAAEPAEDTTSETQPEESITSEVEPNVDNYPDVPVADNFAKAIEVADYNSMDLINKRINSNYVTFASVEGRESGKEIKVTIFVEDDMDLLASQVETLRNVAVDIVQEAGLLKKADYETRTTKVEIKWDYELYKYTFTLGSGWDQQVQ